MNNLATLAANNAMVLQGQPCLIVDHLKSLDEPKAATCIARPSVAETFGERISGENYDITVLRENKMRVGDEVHLLDEENEVESVLVITKPAQSLTAMRVYIAIPKKV
jgi:hypothetical protein